MIALTIWEHPYADQPFPHDEPVATVTDPALAGELVKKAEALGYEFSHELFGMYHFAHTKDRTTACIAVVK